MGGPTDKDIIKKMGLWIIDLINMNKYCIAKVDLKVWQIFISSTGKQGAMMSHTREHSVKNTSYLSLLVKSMKNMFRKTIDFCTCISIKESHSIPTTSIWFRTE